MAAAFRRVREHIALQQVDGRAYTLPSLPHGPVASQPTSVPEMIEDSAEATARAEKEPEHDVDGASQRSRRSAPGRDSASRPSSLTPSHPDTTSSSTLTAPITPQMSGTSRPATPVRGEGSPQLNSHAPVSPSLPVPRSTSPTRGDTQHVSRGSLGRSSKSARPASTSSWKRASLSAAMAGAGRSLWRTTTPAHLRAASTASSALGTGPNNPLPLGPISGLTSGSAPGVALGTSELNSNAGGSDAFPRSVVGSTHAEANSNPGLHTVSEAATVSVPPPPVEADGQISGSALQKQERANEGSGSPVTSNGPKTMAAATAYKVNGLSDPPISTGAVIRHLTSEVQQARENLASTQRALISVQSEQREISRSLGDAREARARAEEDVQAAERMLTRRERLLADARDRLRGAEQKARALGAASREKGTRLRELEAKLGQQRREAARQEAAYEALRVEWDAARSFHRHELSEIKTANARDAETFCSELAEHQSRWKALAAPSTTAAFAAAATSGRMSFASTPGKGTVQDESAPSNGSGDGVAAAVASLRAEQDAAASAIGSLLDPLVAQARDLEERDNRVEELLLDALHEIRRLHRLALEAP